MLSLVFACLLAPALRVFASPVPANSPLEERHNKQQCKHDPLYTVVHGPKLSCDASAFCSSYIAPTETCTKTTHPTVTVTCPTTKHDRTAYTTVTISQETTVTTAIPYTNGRVEYLTTLDGTVVLVETISSDFTTTDQTIGLTLTDFETFTTTDATIFATEVDVEDFTTTDATVFATETIPVDVTQVDVVTNVFTTVVATVTVTAVAVVPRDVKPSPNDPFMVGAPKPTATATLVQRNAPKLQHPKELSKALKPYSPDCLSSACSCLIAKPSTVYTTKTRAGKASTVTARPVVHKTSTCTRYATVGGGAVHFAGVSSEVDVTSQSLVELTTTLQSTEVDVYTQGATLTLTETVTQVATDEETLLATLTQTSIRTIDATAFETQTQLVTNVVGVTVTTVVEADVTATATATPADYCSGDNTATVYTAPNGKRFQLNCNGFYPIRPGGLVGAGNFPSIVGCLDLCSGNTNCVGVDYDSVSGLCDLFNAQHNPSASGFRSALLIAA